MTREEAEQLLPIIKAFSEGKEIEGFYKGTKSPWFKIKDMDFNEGIIFRIKPDPKYRPFKDAEECWQEMQKHQPFGWLKEKNDGHLTLITVVDDEDMMALSGNSGWDFLGISKTYTFADGTPFGMKDEE